MLCLHFTAELLTVSIMWTHTLGKYCPQAGWRPNHFVLLGHRHTERYVLKYKRTLIHTQPPPPGVVVCVWSHVWSQFILAKSVTEKIGQSS